MKNSDDWVKTLAAFVSSKGKIEPELHRAFGHEAPSLHLADAKLWWRDRRIRFGNAAEGSSSQLQQYAALNEATTWFPQRSEGEHLREGVHPKHEK
ncbi:MAG: hypothetical protein ABJC26_18445 [Gemmatimonadaceae bacterium]